MRCEKLTPFEVYGSAGKLSAARTPADLKRAEVISGLTCGVVLLTVPVIYFQLLAWSAPSQIGRNKPEVDSQVRASLDLWSTRAGPCWRHA